jgi:iron complex outermembrane receptor protein
VSRNNWDVFAEVNVPVVKGLELNGAIRFDDYENVGNTWNPKFSMRWTPLKEVLLRSQWGTGFRAPTLPELFAPPAVSSTGGNYTDPQRCPVTKAVEDCNVQFNDQIGGNTLKAERESTSWGFGGVWSRCRRQLVRRRYWSVRSGHDRRPGAKPLRRSGG